MKIIVKAYGNDAFPPKLDGVLGGLMLKNERARKHRGVLPPAMNDSEKQRGIRVVPVTFNGHTFPSVTEAARQIGVKWSTFQNWVHPSAGKQRRERLAAAIAKWEANDKRPLGDPQ